jgi:hypothetical protein
MHSVTHQSIHILSATEKFVNVSQHGTTELALDPIAVGWPPNSCLARELPNADFVSCHEMHPPAARHAFP